MFYDSNSNEEIQGGLDPKPFSNQQNQIKEGWTEVMLHYGHQDLIRTKNYAKEFHLNHTVNETLKVVRGTEVLIRKKKNFCSSEFWMKLFFHSLLRYLLLIYLSVVDFV